MRAGPFADVALLWAPSGCGLCPRIWLAGAGRAEPQPAPRGGAGAGAGCANPALLQQCAR